MNERYVGAPIYPGYEDAYLTTPGGVQRHHRGEAVGVPDLQVHVRESEEERGHPRFPGTSNP